MTDREFLIWIHEMLEHDHGHRHLLGYMHRLRSIITAIPAGQTTPDDGRGKNSLTELQHALAETQPVQPEPALHAYD